MLPKSVILYITSHCPLRCSHCFLTRSGELNKSELSFEEIIRILDDLQENKVFLLAIAGGDPILHEGFFKIAAEARRRSILPLVALTGLSIDSATAEKIYDVGIPCVQIGLDGSSERKNAFYRGDGTFELIKASVINMQKANIKVNVSFCIDQNNVEDVEAMLKFALELGFYKVKITFWRSELGSVDEKHKELNIREKYFIADLCEKFQDQHRLDEWIVSPSPIISEGSLASIHRKALVIKSDGEIALDEFKESIGNIKEGKPSFFYEKFMKMMEMSERNEFL